VQPAASPWWHWRSLPNLFFDHHALLPSCDPYIYTYTCNMNPP
jgi:hypothetical protein